MQDIRLSTHSKNMGIELLRSEERRVGKECLSPV